jgi:hypothetical protein
VEYNQRVRMLPGRRLTCECPDDIKMRFLSYGSLIFVGYQTRYSTEVTRPISLFSTVFNGDLKIDAVA